MRAWASGRKMKERGTCLFSSSGGGRGGREVTSGTLKISAFLEGKECERVAASVTECKVGGGSYRDSFEKKEGKGRGYETTFAQEWPSAFCIRDGGGKKRG